MGVFKAPAFLDSPFFTFCIPPALFVLQFLVMALLSSTGFPNVEPTQKVKAGMLIVALFGTTFFALIGAGWGIRQVFLSQNKFVSALGVAFNGLYFLGLIIFYVAIFITNASN
jgi:hypothetical protein